MTEDVPDARWSFVPHGTEWLYDVDSSYTAAFEQLVDMQFDDIDSAVDALEHVLSGTYRTPQFAR